MNGGRRPNQGRGTANQNEPGRGKHPHSSRRGTIQITMINIIHIPTGRDGLRRGGDEIIREIFPYENCNTNIGTVRIQARLAKNNFFFGHLFFNITNVFCAKKRVGHACICPRMVTG